MTFDHNILKMNVGEMSRHREFPPPRQQQQQKQPEKAVLKIVV